jgi:hypothetical protein
MIDEEVELAAWDFWHKRLRSADVLATPEAAICAVAGRGPSRLLSLPPEEMTARAWSKAFYEGFHRLSSGVSSATGEPFVPQWLSYAALLQLGFTMEPRSFLAHTAFGDPGEVAGLDIASFDFSQRRKKPKGSALIITRIGGESEKWKPSNEWAVLVLRRAEYDQLIGRVRRPPFVTLVGPLNWIVFDCSIWPAVGEQPERHRVDTSSIATDREFADFYEVLHRFDPKTEYIPAPVMVPSDWRGELPRPFFPIPAPNSFEELFTIIARERSRSVPA